MTECYNIVQQKCMNKSIGMLTRNKIIHLSTPYNDLIPSNTPSPKILIFCWFIVPCFVYLTTSAFTLMRLQQEAQLPQRNSASATHDYLAWSSDLLMITLGGSRHRTQQNRRGCVILWHSNALIQQMLAGNGFWHEIVSQGHSRSFILQSFAGQQGVA